MSVPQRPINPRNTVNWIEERMSRERDPRVRANIAGALRHFVSELRGDVDATMATMTAEPTNLFYGYMRGDKTPVPRTIDGAVAMRQSYTASAAAGTLQAQELDMKYLVADAGGVVFECFARFAIATDGLRSMGHAVGDAKFYLYQGMVCCHFVCDDNSLVIGEHVFLDPAGFEAIEQRPLDEADVVHFTGSSAVDLAQPA